MWMSILELTWKIPDIHIQTRMWMSTTMGKPFLSLTNISILYSVVRY